MIFWVSLVLLAFYVLLILVYFIGWLLIPSYKVSDRAGAFTYSIIIPARNEEAVIEKCIEDILHQQFDKSRYEVIIVNDHSDDTTADKVAQFISNNRFSTIRLLQMKDDPEQRKLKKAAITFGIGEAKGDYIILTDADCERGSLWLKTIDAYVTETKAKMVYAPVAFKATNIFEKIQSMEFAGLVAIGGSAIRLKNPNMCSAANLLFEKSAFYEVKGYEGNEGIASGDDEFLLHKIFKRYPDQVSFLKNNQAIVHTSANVSLTELADQRKRWVSKSTKYENRFITAILVAAYLFNALIVYHLFAAPLFGIQMLLVKMSVEAIFLFSVLYFFKRTTYLLWLPVAEIFHILYVLIIGILANTSAYRWKGRSIR